MKIQSYSAYDSDSVRMLTGVLFEAKNKMEASLRRPFDENERAEATRLVADRLMRAFDLGERNRNVLLRVALEGQSPKF